MSYSGHPQSYPNYDHQPHSAYVPQPNYEEYEKERVSTEKGVGKRSCLDRVCCGCCTCCPRWCRWVTCILFLIVVALGIVIGILASQFKMPEVYFIGIQGSPSFGIARSQVDLGLNIEFAVNNPNIESVTFSSLDALAYYHGFNQKPIGGGTLHNLHIGSNSVTHFQFPFTLHINLIDRQDQDVILRLLSDCGIGGEPQQKIKLDYRVIATVKVVGISIHIPITNTVDFDCPINPEMQHDLIGSMGQAVLGLLGHSAPASDNSNLPTDRLSAIAATLSKNQIGLSKQ